jgi:DNA-binding MarR family transcriptional regulator
VAQANKSQRALRSEGRSARSPSGGPARGSKRSESAPTPDACLEDDHDAHSRWAVEEWPEIEEVVEAIVGRIDTVQRHIERASVDTRNQLALAHGELKVLLRLARGVRSQGALAKNLLVSTGTMTNQLDKLEEAGLVVRHPDPDDRRGKLVEMTAKGRGVLDKYINVQAMRERQLVGGLSEREKVELNFLLRKLLASLRQQASAPGSGQGLLPSSSSQNHPRQRQLST